MLSGDCNVCINGKMPSYSATCVECGLSRKNYKPISNADRIRAMTDEELAEWISLATWRAFANGAGNMNYVDAARIEVGEWLDWLKQEADNGKN